MYEIIKRELTVFTIFTAAAVIFGLYSILLGLLVLIIGLVYLYKFTNNWIVGDKDLRNRVMLTHGLVSFLALLWIGLSFPLAWVVAVIVVVYLIFLSILKIRSL